MVAFEFNDKQYYIDNRLKTQLDKKVIPDLKRNDKDAVFVVDGEERSGKSVFSMGMGAYISAAFKKNFDLSNVCMDPLEFRSKIETAGKNEVVIYDEAHRGMASARSLSEINKILKDLMMEMGQRNLFVIIVLPTIFLLDKYAALFRARGLFHVYENKRRRGYWTYFNKKNKLLLYMRGKKEFNYNCMKYPYFRGRFYNQYPIDEALYREKKGNSFKTSEKTTKTEKFESQRNLLYWIMYNEYDIPVQQIVNQLKIYSKKYKTYETTQSTVQMHRILKPFKEKDALIAEP